MSIVFLFGAGASAFSGECYPKAPPLGNTLFAELREAGGIAAEIESDIASLFADSFEVGMAEFQKRHRSDAPAFLRQMSAYFAKFEPGPANLYFDVLRILRASRRRFVIATVNYDLLIERAATIAGGRIAYHAPPVPTNNISLLKLHGSCNFLPNAAGVKIFDIGFDLPGAEDANLETTVRVAQPEEVDRVCKHQTALAPVVALYAVGKQILYCPAFVRQQQHDWSKVVAEASRIYIVGVRLSVHDVHVWMPLQKTQAKVFYIGPDAQDFLAWAAESRRKPSFHLTTSFEAFPSILRRHISAK